jgi:TetR/AcrR family tetracycline transcriptional repressor
MSADIATKRRRGRPSKISKEQVLAAARTLAVEDLTMPALANILGVKTPALYHHFSSREALVGEIGQQLFAEMPLPRPDPKNWRPWLHSINMQLYQFIVKNPLLIEASDSAQGFLSLTINLCEAILETLQQAGFEKQQSYWIMISLTQIAYSTGGECP